MHPARMQLAAERSCLLLCLPSVFSCPPNTYSSYKGGTWFFFFSCFREVVKKLPEAAELAASTLPGEASTCLHSSVVISNINPKKTDRKQSGGRSTVRKSLLGASISHLPLGWDIPSSRATADPGKQKLESPVGWELELKKTGRKHKWVSIFSFKGRLNLSYKTWFLVIRPWTSHLTCSCFVQAFTLCLVALRSSLRFLW